MEQNQVSRGRDTFKKFKKLLALMTAFVKLFPVKIRIKLLEAFRGMKGKKGMALRYAILCAVAQKVGDNVAIFEDVIFVNPDKLSVGSNVSIHPMCYLHCFGRISIGDNVSIAQGTTLLSINHVYDCKNVPIRDQGVEKRPLKIGSNIWIGAQTVILGGLQISDGVVIGAASVVTKSVEENVVVVGNPAKAIRKR